MPEDEKKNYATQSMRRSGATIDAAKGVPSPQRQIKNWQGNHQKILIITPYMKVMITPYMKVQDYKTHSF